MTNIPPELLKGLEHDEEIKQRIRQLVMLAVDEAHELLVSGAPAIKQNVMRTLLPAAVRVAQQNDQDEELNQLRIQVMALMKEVRGEKEDQDTDDQTGTETSGPNPPNLTVINSD